MILDSKYKPEVCCSEDDLRLGLLNCHLKDSILVATDGHVLVVVPVQEEPGDSQGYVTPGALSAARKATKKGQPVQITVNATQVLPDGTMIPRPSTKDLGVFPDWKQVVPDNTNAHASFAVDVRLLVRAAKALGTSNVRIVLTRANSWSEPLTLTAHEEHESEKQAFAVVMPLRK